MTHDANILIVDDEPANRMILEDLLGEWYAVRSLADGQQALDYLQGGAAADLILLDVMMPELDGFEVCRRVKATPALQDKPGFFL